MEKFELFLRGKKFMKFEVIKASIIIKLLTMDLTTERPN
jgi:hypothetical protein